MYLEVLENQEQNKPRVNRRKEITKTEVEMKLKLGEKIHCIKTGLLNKQD